MNLTRACRIGLLSISALALPVRADLVKHKDWDKSPEFVYLTTDDEKKAWKAVKADEDADRFIALFWAKRNPDLKNPNNEFKQIFEARVAKADEVFALGKKRGALTERGKLFILIGPPKTMAQKAQSSADVQAGSTAQQGSFIGTGGAMTITYQFLYEQPQLPKWADVQSLDAKFQVDTNMNSEHVIDMGPIKRLEKKAVEMALAHPELKEPPVYKTREQVEAEQKAAAEEAAEKARGAALAPAVRETLVGVLAKEPFGVLSAIPLAYGENNSKVMVQILAPASAVPAPEAVRLAILVRGKDGKDAARRDEPAKLQKSKGDYFADRTITLPAGEYDVAVALLDASGAVLASGRRSASVPTLPTEFAASPVLIAYNDFPFEGKPEADEPFVFFVRKFVGKGDSKIDGSDGLSYYLRVYNPSVDPTTKTFQLKRTLKIRPKGGSAVELPVEPEKPTPAPDTKGGPIVIDIASNIVETKISDYFAPGEWELMVALTDVVSGKPPLKMTIPFTIVGPPKTAAPAPAKKK